MPVTLTTSQRVAAAAPAAEPTILIDLQTNEGLEYHFATQACSWSGIDYAARLLDVSQLQTGIQTAPEVLPQAKSLSFDLANADAFFSAKRPAWIRGQRVTYKEVFLDVPSDAVRTFRFTVTNQSVPDDRRFHVEAEDILATVRRFAFPSNDTVITTSLYPNLWFGDAEPLADGKNRPIPWLFGRTMCPLYYVDQASDGSHIYTACIGSAYFTGSGAVYDWFDGGLSLIGYPDPNSGFVNDAMSIFPWSVSYAVRHVTRFDGSTVSMPVTEVILHPLKGPGFSVGRRFADLTWNRGSSAFTTPDEVLIWMMRDCFAGPHFNPVDIDSDSLLAARSFYLANSIYFDGALIEQRPLEQWLGQWQHDALTRINMRDKLYLVTANSRTATGSFHTGNILAGEIQYRDKPLGDEQSRRTVFFKERTQDADYGPGNGAALASDRGGSQIRWEAGSGAEIATISPFIGRPSVAARVVQYWAKSAFYGIREYELGSTVRQTAIDDGDLVTLTSSIGGAAAQLCEVTGTTRQAGRYTFNLTETNYAVFSHKPYGPDPAFEATYQRVAYLGGDDIGVGVPFTILGIHQLNATPTRMRAVPSYDHNFLQASLAAFATNNSLYAVTFQLIGITPASGQTQVHVSDYLGGWDLFI